MGAYLSTAGPRHSHHPSRPDVFRPLRHPQHQGRHPRLYSPTRPRWKPTAARAARKPPSCWSGWWTCWPKNLDLDPVEVRRRNLIPKFDNGHDTAIGLTYDSGDYQRHPGYAALAQVDYAGLRAMSRQHEREHGQLHGHRRHLLLPKSAAWVPPRLPARWDSAAACGKAPLSVSTPRARSTSSLGLPPTAKVKRPLSPRLSPTKLASRYRRRRGHPRRHRQHPHGLGHLRQPNHRGRRRRRRP